MHMKKNKTKIRANMFVLYDGRIFHDPCIVPKSISEISFLYKTWQRSAVVEYDEDVLHLQ